MSMSEKKKRSYKVIGLFLLLLILPVSLMVLKFYQPPHHFPTGYVATIISETGNYASDFQTKDGLFVEPTIAIIYNTVSTFSCLNDSSPFSSADLNQSRLSHFALTRQNLDGGFSDFAGAGNILSTYEALMIVNQTAPEAFKDNISRMNSAYVFINACQNEDSGYKTSSPPELPEELNFELGYEIPAKNYILNRSTIENTFEAVSSLDLINRTHPRVSETINFVNNPVNGCRRNFSPAAGYAPSKYELEPDLHSTYYGVATLLQLNVSISEINQPLSRVTLFILSCYDNSTGGFAIFPLNGTDITSTYYGVAALSLLNYNYSTSLILNKTRIIEYIKSAQNLDGGFGGRPGASSDFQSAHHAVAALTILNASIETTSISALYNWFINYEARNGLFGGRIVQAQYCGIRSASINGHINYLNITSLTYFLKKCQNLDGGFGEIPYSTSTVVDTYAAVESLALINQLSQINGTHAVQWLQYHQAEEGGFASEISLSTFLSQYSPIYGRVAEVLLNESRPSTVATCLAVAALKILDAQPLNRTSLRLWLLGAQNADGGFPFSLGIRSEALSTFYAVQALALINQRPFSPTSCVEFLKGCQMQDGGFTFYPLIGEYINFSYLFVSYSASKALYLLKTQPNDVFGAMDWLLTCKDGYTLGFGDKPYFGADLRNAPNLMDIVRELNIDNSFQPTSWIRMVFWLLIVEIAALASFGVIKLATKYRSTLGGITRTHPNIEEFPAVHVKGLTIKAGKKVILEDVNMTLQHGEVLGVLGESGAGKSTFVKSLLGTKGSKGEIKIYGFDIRKERTRLKPLIGYVPQDLGKIYTNFTVMENLIHFGKQYGLSEKDIFLNGSKILRDLGILEKKDDLVSELSGGQRRRASIAIAMIHSPTLFVLDEPTSGLDPIVREQLWMTLLELAEHHNTTLIVVSHYPEESKFCTRMAIFGRKRGMIDYGPPQELINNLPGSGRSVDLILQAPSSIDPLPILKKLPEIDFVLEEKRHLQYRLFTNLPVATIQSLVVQALGIQSLTLRQTEATMVDYFRIKSLEVKN